MLSQILNVRAACNALITSLSKVFEILGTEISNTLETPYNVQFEWHDLYEIQLFFS